MLTAARLATVFEDVRRAQDGIVARRQVFEAGLSPAYIRARIDSGAWRPVGSGVIATFSGPLSRAAVLWAAVLRAGVGATLSHTSAAEVHGLIDGESPTIHVSLPLERRIRAIPGIVVHYSRRLPEARHPTRQPPITRIDETVLDVIEP